MTINDGIGLTNAAIAATFAVMAGTALWQARAYWLEWPVSFLVAIGGWIATLMLFIGQIAVFRWSDYSGLFGPNGWGTLGLRLLCLGFSLALLRRLATGNLATVHDMRRARGGDG